MKLIDLNTEQVRKHIKEEGKIFIISANGDGIGTLFVESFVSLLVNPSVIVLNLGAGGLEFSRTLAFTTNESALEHLAEVKKKNEALKQGAKHLGKPGGQVSEASKTQPEQKEPKPANEPSEDGSMSKEPVKEPEKKVEVPAEKKPEPALPAKEKKEDKEVKKVGHA